MKFSIITPTLQRDSLVRCCESVNSQSYSYWDHVVFVDAEKMDKDMIDKIRHPQRTVICMGKKYGDFGNTPRNLAWRFATGDWVHHMDDDNLYADNDILSDIAHILKDCEKDWALFPIMRHGQRFFNNPPRSCHVDTMNMVIRREFARWPVGPDYTMDGIFCDRLVAEREFAAFPDFRPIGIMEVSNVGR